MQQAELKQKLLAPRFVFQSHLYDFDPQRVRVVVDADGGEIEIVIFVGRKKSDGFRKRVNRELGLMIFFVGLGQQIQAVRRVAAGLGLFQGVDRTLVIARPGIGPVPGCSARWGYARRAP